MAGLSQATPVSTWTIYFLARAAIILTRTALISQGTEARPGTAQTVARCKQRDGRGRSVRQERVVERQPGGFPLARRIRLSGDTGRFKTESAGFRRRPGAGSKQADLRENRRYR